MLDYTKTAIRQTVDDFKKIDFIRNIATQAIYIVYLIYAICVQTGVLIANIILLTLACAYFVFFLYMKTRGVKKQLKRMVRDIYKWCRRLIKLFTLGVMIYGLSLTASHFTPLSLVLAALMIVGWVLQLVFEVVFKFFLGRAQFILEGMEADYEKLTKPVKTVGNFFKKLTGKEVEEEKAPSKNRLLLDKKIAQEKAKKTQEKESARLDRKVKFDLWLQDKAQLFKGLGKKKGKQDQEDIILDQIPAPSEEEHKPDPEEIETNFDDEI